MIMPTVHIEANEKDIAKTVLMPGDPKRAEYIAKKYLHNARLVNLTRGITAYTGSYKGKEITVFPSGMGMPSAGIYSYELFKFYRVDNIIRIGTCGSFNPNIKVLDTLLVDKSYTEGNFAMAVDNRDVHLMEANFELNSLIEKVSIALNAPVVKGNIFCNDFFDVYTENFDLTLQRIPKNLNIIGVEMESFAIFYNASLFGKKAACLLSVVDSHYDKTVVSAKDRETSLDNMIIIALESSLKL